MMSSWQVEASLSVADWASSARQAAGSSARQAGSSVRQAAGAAVRGSANLVVAQPAVPCRTRSGAPASSTILRARAHARAANILVTAAT